MCLSVTISRYQVCYSVCDDVVCICVCAMNQIPAENSSNERHKNAISQPASQPVEWGI